MPDPVDYRDPTTELPHPRRSPGLWMVLVIIWIVGIGIWGLYLALIGFLVLRFA
jgi:hypothetical protein